MSLIGNLLQASVVLARVSEGTSDAGQFAAALALATPGSLVAAALSLVRCPSMSAAFGRGDRAAVRRQAYLATRGLAPRTVAAFGAARPSCPIGSSLTSWGATRSRGLLRCCR